MTWWRAVALAGRNILYLGFRHRMYRVRIISRLILLLVILAAIPVLAISNVLLRDDARRAKSLYQVTAAGVQKSQDDLSEVEARLTRLTTSVGAVETEARRQLRMVKPGETFVLVQQEKGVAVAAEPRGR